MPRLLLLRHAKSSWPDPGQADGDRPLARRGRRAAERMAALIAGRTDLVPDRILCSPARRTRETLAPLLTRLGNAKQVLIADELYEPEGGEYLDTIATSGGTIERLLVIGHNPAIQMTALSLINSGSKNAALQLAAKFPTAALAIIDLDVAGWSEIRPKTGCLVDFIRPRDLETGDTATDGL